MLYGRWWEALINALRNRSLKTVVLIEAPQDDLIKVGRPRKFMAWLLKGHLRAGASLEDAEEPFGHDEEDLEASVSRHSQL